MGIRFLCPNGHKLNVKAFLAGKRGICPQCDAKFLVPKESGVQADVFEDPQAESVVLDPGQALPLGYGATSQPLSTPPPTSSSTPSPPPPPAPPAAEPPPAQVSDTVEPATVWYVRTPAGEQYGPASTAVMHSWVAEGRVAVDSWVWRSGWPDWKSGGHAITFLNGPAGESEQAASPIASPGVNDAPADASLPVATDASAVYQHSRRSRQERARRVTFLLAGVVLLLFAILIVVLINNSR